MACKISVPWPAIKPWPLAVGTLGPDPWTVREFLGIDIFVYVFIDIFKLDNSITLVYLKSVYSNFPTWCNSVGKETVCNAGDLGSISGSGRSPGEGNSNPVQYSCLENPMERGAWQATVHGVARAGHHLATELPPPTHTSLLAPCGHSSDVNCSQSLLTWLLKGRMGKRSSHLLRTYSPFLLLWSKGRINRLGKALCDQKIWEVC